MAVGTAFSSPLMDTRRVNTYTYRHRMGMVSSAEFLVVHDDFVQDVGTNLPTGGLWEAAIIDTGATIVSDTTVGAGHGHGALIWDSDGAAEGAAIYTNKVFQLTSGKRFFMECRFKTELADDTDVQFGLTIFNATTNPEDLWTTTATDLVAFGLLDGDATVTMLSDKSNSGSTAELGSLDVTSATWTILAIFYDGTRLFGFVDGQRALTWSQAASTIPTGVPMGAFVGFRNGSAATNEGQCDYIRIVSER